MYKYKIHRTSKPVSEEKINQHKDFGKILANYNQVYSYKKATRPLYKDVKFLGLIITIVVIILLLFLPDGKEQNGAEKGVKIEKK